MEVRPRRLRLNSQIRALSRETRLSSTALIYPLFIKEGSGIKTPILSLEGQFHHSPDRVCETVEYCLAHGVDKFILFGLPNEKDPYGLQAYADNGVVQQAVRTLRSRFNKDILICTDVCMCEYTSHGHCGILTGEYVDNDITLEYLCKIAVSHAQAGADVVAPSDMMDGRVAAIRHALDQCGFENTLIMSYAVKYASSFYGPFREAAGSAPTFGDRKTYQMDYHNKKEATKEALLDMQEGADMLIVKPALAYLDVISDISKISPLPTVAYSVSGEYAMVKAAAKMGLVDGYKTMCECAVSIFRAGANVLITYDAVPLADAMKKGDIG